MWQWCLSREAERHISLAIGGTKPSEWILDANEADPWLQDVLIWSHFLLQPICNQVLSTPSKMRPDPLGEGTDAFRTGAQLWAMQNPMVSYFQSVPESINAGGNCCDGGAVMANTDLVSTAGGKVSGFSEATPTAMA